VVGEAQRRGTPATRCNWRYTLRPAGGRHSIEVQFDDWMYLMDDRVMLEPRRA
jgi:hypothetical protein